MSSKGRVRRPTLRYLRIRKGAKMATEEGVIEKVVKEKAVVRIRKTSACTH